MRGEIPFESRENRGSVLVMAIIFMFILLILGMVLIDLVVAEYRTTHRDVNALRALAHAEAGVDLAMDILCRQDIYPNESSHVFDEGWNFRGTINRLFGSGTYTAVTPFGTYTYAVDASDVVADADGGFQVVVSEPTTGVVQVDSWGFVNGNTRETAEHVYKATVRLRQMVQPLVDAIRARGTVRFNGSGSGTQPVEILDTDGDGTVEPGEILLLTDPQAHARSTHGDINGPSGRVRGSATVYGAHVIIPTVDGEINYEDAPPPANMLVPGPDVMERNRQRWLDAAGGWAYHHSGLSGDYSYNASTGVLSISNNGTATLTAPARLESISVGNGATLIIQAAANPSQNVVYVGNLVPVNGPSNTTQKVDIGSGGRIQSAALLVVNGRMETNGQFLLDPSVTNSAVGDVAGLCKAALIVLGDDQSGGHPALKLRSANQATEATGTIYCAGSIDMGGNGYVTGALLAYGDVTFSGSGCRVYFPVNMFPPPGFTQATMVAYHVARQR